MFAALHRKWMYKACFTRDWITFYAELQLHLHIPMQKSYRFDSVRTDYDFCVVQTES